MHQTNTTTNSTQITAEVTSEMGSSTDISGVSQPIDRVQSISSQEGTDFENETQPNASFNGINVSNYSSLSNIINQNQMPHQQPQYNHNNNSQISQTMSIQQFNNYGQIHPMNKNVNFHMNYVNQMMHNNMSAENVDERKEEFVDDLDDLSDSSSSLMGTGYAVTRGTNGPTSKDMNTLRMTVKTKPRLYMDEDDSMYHPGIKTADQSPISPIGSDTGTSGYYGQRV